MDLFLCGTKAVRRSAQLWHTLTYPTCLLLAVFCTSLAGAADSTYPSRAMAIIVPYAAGGGGDTYTRAVAAADADELQR